MARSTEKTSKVLSAPSDTQVRSSSEVRDWYEEQKTLNFASAQSAATQLRSSEKTVTKTITSFNKDTLRSYLQNIGSNENNLRNLSWYLFYRCQVYARIILFNANMFCLDARSIIPKYDLLGENDSEKTLKSYMETIQTVENMRLQHELYNAYVNCFIQDVFYAIVLYDEEGIFLYPIPAAYGKIIGKFKQGDFSYAIDMTYFRSRQEVLEYIPDPLKTMYQEYQRTGQKWVAVPDEYSLCLKYRSEDYESVIPPFVDCFNAFINLTDLEDIQAVADEQDIYKMLWIELETLSGSDIANDWKVDPKLVVEYYNRMIAKQLPDYISAAIIPGKINEISFPQDKTADTTKVAKATESVLNTAGGAEILNGATISGAEAFRYAQIANTEYAISSLLAQTQAWVNRFISYHVSDPCKVRFFPISVYTKSKFKEELTNSGANGLPLKLALNTLNGFSELDTLAMNYLEEDVLNLSEKLKPFTTSYTRSGSDNRTGRPRDSEQTSDGEASEDKRDRSEG